MSGYGENAVEKGDMIAAMTAAMSQDNSSCSCIEGNPCLNADNCNDWHKRHAPLPLPFPAPASHARL
ncbi:hypothetical protein T484DRAFT_1769108 [Baffinella frigidus]|nr:hypothetical protein T484DRAFT_1769108 [Cryptophyta sp. CCMP2293]